MNVWILIIMLWRIDGGTSSISTMQVEYQSKNACLVAQESIRKAVNGVSTFPALAMSCTHKYKQDLK